jgi:hypothetical protein
VAAAVVAAGVVIVDCRDRTPGPALTVRRIHRGHLLELKLYPLGVYGNVCRVTADGHRGEDPLAGHSAVSRRLMPAGPRARHR